MSLELPAEITPLITAFSPAALGAETRPDALSIDLVHARIEAAFSKVGTPRKAGLIRSLILLWHDHLDASHGISQSEDNADGSLIHAIMHRREPDCSNAKYWWRATGNHPCFAALADRVATGDCHDESLLASILPAGKWDPFAFTDLVAEGLRQPADSPRHVALKAVQQIEFESMLEHLLN